MTEPQNIFRPGLNAGDDAEYTGRAKALRGKIVNVSRHVGGRVAVIVNIPIGGKYNYVVRNVKAANLKLVRGG